LEFRDCLEFRYSDLGFRVILESEDYVYHWRVNQRYVQNIGKSIREKDKSVIQKCALEQIKQGADALDVNCGPASANPISDIQWLVETIQEVTDKPLSLDSSNPKVIEAGLKVMKNQAIINSTTADKEKLEVLVPLAKNIMPNS